MFLAVIKERFYILLLETTSYYLEGSIGIMAHKNGNDCERNLKIIMLFIENAYMNQTDMNFHYFKGYDPINSLIFGKESLFSPVVLVLKL